MEDTIAAIATPPGQGGIGIVRISGSRAREIARKIFVPKKSVSTLQSHHLYLGHLIDPSAGAIIDEVMLSVMMAPFSYTREDVAEINSHSGFVLLSKILQITLNAGARLARPGEFTFRAYMNGRIDLTQAEAVVDLIHSRSEKGLLLAAKQIGGGFRREIETLRQKGLERLARIEAAIDFPEDGLAALSAEAEILALKKDLLEPIERLLEAHRERKIWMEGIATAIVGRVNAGKSSLFNRLLNEQRALVTSIPGTTRDTIESTLYVEGIPLRLMDTAGFRRGRGRIENLGIQMSEQTLSEADLVLVVIDRSRPLSRDDSDLLSRTEGKNSLIILNKTDLPARTGAEVEARKLGGRDVVKTSALTGTGMDELRRAITARLLPGGANANPLDVAPNLRHKNGLTASSEHFRAACINLKKKMPLEIVAADLQSGLEALAEIVGSTTPEDVLERIFSEFCIGK